MGWCARPLAGKPESHSPHPLEPLVQGRSRPRFFGVCPAFTLHYCSLTLLFA